MKYNNGRIKTVEDSLDGRPMFLIAMDDGKEYISFSDTFVENTPANRSSLTERPAAKFHLALLFATPWGDMCDIIDARYMFNGCLSLTSFAGNTSNVRRVGFMFLGCIELTEFVGNLSAISSHRDCFMFGACHALAVENIFIECPQLLDYTFIWFTGEHTVATEVILAQSESHALDTFNSKYPGQSFIGFGIGAINWFSWES